MKLTGWTAQQIDDTPGVLCDWLLALENVEREAEAQLERQAARRQR